MKRHSGNIWQKKLEIIAEIERAVRFSLLKAVISVDDCSAEVRLIVG